MASIPPEKETEFSRYEFETEAAAEAHLNSAQFEKNVAEFTAAWPESERFVIRAVQVYPWPALLASNAGQVRSARIIHESLVNEPGYALK